MNLSELNRRFAISGVAEVVAGNGNLPKVQVTSATAAGEIYLHGAHVTSWKPTGAEDVFFRSPHSLWQDGKAIRGGIPVCFPWFGAKADDPHAPDHGFVRTREWTLNSIERNGDAVSVSMMTESDDSTRKWWPFDFRLVNRATFGTQLTVELAMTNTSSSPLRFEEALHAYYRVGDVTKAEISGLDGVHYLDKTDSFREKAQSGNVVIQAETDRVYLNTEHALELHDSVLQRKIIIAKQNSRNTVVWNPWKEKAHALADLGADLWKNMLCIEVANVGEFAINLAPGEQHTMTARVSVAQL